MTMARLSCGLGSSSPFSLSRHRSILCQQPPEECHGSDHAGQEGRRRPTAANGRPELKAEFERESRSPNGCVGIELLSETDRVRVWIIRLAPGERIGFHRHVLDYFWTSVNGGRGRQHLMDGSTVEYSYFPGETRHETYGPGEYKVHDLENLGDKEMIFNTIEFLDSANKPLPVPDRVRVRRSKRRSVARRYARPNPSAEQTSQAAALPAHCRPPGETATNKP